MTKPSTCAGPLFVNVSMPSWLPTPQFWIAESVSLWPCHQSWLIGFKDVTAPTNVRTMIAAAIPASGVGNTLPVIMPENDDTTWYRSNGPLALANLNSIMFDFVARQKVQGQHLNWFIVEQLPVIPAAAYDRRFGKKTARAIVRKHVIALTYTAHDMAPFAIDMGHVDSGAAGLCAMFAGSRSSRELCGERLLNSLGAGGAGGCGAAGSFKCRRVAKRSCDFRRPSVRRDNRWPRLHAGAVRDKGAS
jgi:hypothetical protein